MSAQTFISNLPVVDLATLGPEDQHCNICFLEYCGPHAYLNPYASEGEVPVKLPCNHIFGADCLTTWLSENDSCPCCRSTLYSITEAELFQRQLRAFGNEEDLRALMAVLELSLVVRHARRHGASWMLAIWRIQCMQEHRSNWYDERVRGLKLKFLDPGK